MSRGNGVKARLAAFAAAVAWIETGESLSREAAHRPPQAPSWVTELSPKGPLTIRRVVWAVDGKSHDMHRAKRAAKLTEDDSHA